MNEKIGIVSLGCAKNQVDAEMMLFTLKQAGYKIVVDPAMADAVIVNTCGFIESAKQESIDEIIELGRLKAEGKIKSIIVTGCLAERYQHAVKEQLYEVDAVVGIGANEDIAKVVEKSLQGEQTELYPSKLCLPLEGGRVQSTPSHYAYLKLGDGCDNRCTYCAIPLIRGKFRSRTMESLIAEAQQLVNSGVKELILIAQDTTRYGKDIYGKYALCDLLEELCKIDELKWIRVHYFYNEAITDELISVMAKNDKICNYVDMPIQHINNRILKRMARRTKRDEIETSIAKLREAMPDVTIRTSLIAGFPGETEEEFEELYDFVKNTRFDRLGVFAYSAEENTPAADFEGQLDEETKQDRLDKIMTLQQQISLEKNRERIGTVTEVLVEGYDSESFLFFGRSRGDSVGVDQTVFFAANDEIDFGDFVQVEILDAGEYDLTGKQI